MQLNAETHGVFETIWRPFANWCCDLKLENTQGTSQELGIEVSHNVLGIAITLYCHAELCLSSDCRRFLDANNHVAINQYTVFRSTVDICLDLYAFVNK